MPTGRPSPLAGSTRSVATTVITLPSIGWEHSFFPSPAFNPPLHSGSLCSTVSISPADGTKPPWLSLIWESPNPILSGESPYPTRSGRSSPCGPMIVWLMVQSIGWAAVAVGSVANPLNSATAVHRKVLTFTRFALRSRCCDPFRSYRGSIP